MMITLYKHRQVKKTFITDGRFFLPQDYYGFLDNQYSIMPGGITVKLIISNNNKSFDVTLSKTVIKGRKDGTKLILSLLKNATNEVQNLYKINDVAKFDHKTTPLYFDLYYDEKNSAFILNCITDDSKDDVSDELFNEMDDENQIIGENRIFYGTPGCGKSHSLKKYLIENGFSNVFRTVFYPDYTYSDFIGQIYPQVKGGSVTYEFIPGPFTLALGCALTPGNDKVALVIEEINRGNAPAIFGEIFQLLDRIEKGNDDSNEIEIGKSKYVINNKMLQDWLGCTEVYLPSNLFIYATMNTSDQNVFTLDTAFKRRWKMTKITNDFTGEDLIKDRIVPGFGISWQKFVETINYHIIATASSLNAEDKQIGKFFVTESDLVEEGDELDVIKDKAREFAEKVLEYLWSDVAKFNRNAWFGAEMKSFDNVLAKVAVGGDTIKDIFAESLRKALWD